MHPVCTYLIRSDFRKANIAYSTLHQSQGISFSKDLFPLHSVYWTLFATHIYWLLITCLYTLKTNFGDNLGNKMKEVEDL